MTEPIYGEMILTATAEVRDKDGNLISSTPVEMTVSNVTEEEVRNYTESKGSK